MLIPGCSSDTAPRRSPGARQTPLPSQVRLQRADLRGSMDTTKDTQKRLSNLRSKLKDVAARKDPDLAEPLRQLSMKLEGQLEPNAADEDERVALANYLERVIASLTTSTTTTKEPPAKATKAAPPTSPRRR